MITTKTVFILGAGSSAPYNYPIGAKLRDDIRRDFRLQMKEIFLPFLYSNISEIREKLKEVEKFQDKFFKSTTPSIDLWLARNSKFSEIGKKAIVSNILVAEKHSSFREDIEDEIDWYSYLYRRMTENLIKPDSFKKFSRNEVSFITFNYDRSLENFLYESLRNSFTEATEEEIINELNKIQIHHVYGVVSKLPWQGGNIPYKAAIGSNGVSTVNIDSIKDNIKIVHEEHNIKDQNIKDAIFTSKRIFFLGFGYAKENLNAIGINEQLITTQPIFGTAFGLKEKEIRVIKTTLEKSIKNRDLNKRGDYIIIRQLDCKNLLREYL